MTRYRTGGGVTSRTKAPRKGTPAYALWLEERRAMNESLRKEFHRHVVLPLLLQGYPRPREEWRFTPAGDWRYDFAWPQCGGLCVDVDGGLWMKDGGGHNTAGGSERDRTKDNEAVCCGLRPLRVTAAMIASGKALEYVERALRAAHTAGAA